MAKRKFRLEKGEDSSVVDGIEAQLNRNKKLQAVKYFSGNVRGYDAKEDVKKEEEVSTGEGKITASDQPHSQVQTVKSKDTTLPVQSSQISFTPAAKTNQNTDAALSEIKTSKANSNPPAGSDGSIGFRAVLKPKDTKTLGPPVINQSKTSSIPESNAGAKASCNKPVAPLPPKISVSPAVSATPQTSKPKAELPLLLTSKTTQNHLETKSSSTTLVSPNPFPVSASPSATNVAAPADYMSLAEKARLEYLKKKATGNLQPDVKKKGPVEITPNRKSGQHGLPVSPISSTDTSHTSSSRFSSSAPKEVMPTELRGSRKGQVSVQERITSLESDLADDRASVDGVTEDHSHTELSLANGTIKKLKPSTNQIAPPPSGFSSKIAPPSSGSGNKDKNSASVNHTRGSHNLTSSAALHSQGKPAGITSPAASHDALSSGSRISISDMIVPPPPPPPDFSDSTLGDQDALIPPPPEFLEIDSNANESKALDKNFRQFAMKPVPNWSCVDVLDWLDSLGLSRYRMGFAKAGVNGTKLVVMGRNDFINLGVNQAGDRMNLEQSVQKLAVSTNL